MITAAELKTITVASPNLFRIAAQEYDDATQWYRIAKANNLWEPFVSGVVTLRIPPRIPASASNGGIREA